MRSPRKRWEIISEETAVPPRRLEVAIPAGVHELEPRMVGHEVAVSKLLQELRPLVGAGVSVHVGDLGDELS